MPSQFLISPLKLFKFRLMFRMSPSQTPDVISGFFKYDNFWGSFLRAQFRYVISESVETGLEIIPSLSLQNIMLCTSSLIVLRVWTITTGQLTATMAVGVSRMLQLSHHRPQIIICGWSSGTDSEPFQWGATLATPTSLAWCAGAWCWLTRWCCSVVVHGCNLGTHWAVRHGWSWWSWCGTGWSCVHWT